MKGLMSAAALFVAAWVPALAQPVAVGGEPGKALLAINTLPPKTHAALHVRSPAFGAGGEIPMANTSYGGSVFPGLAWSWGPYGTMTYAVIMQDDDAIYHGAPILHWSVYDVSGKLKSLPVNMTAPPAGASFGPNIGGPAKAYMGPHTPPGPWHHYHFQVFAVDQVIGSAPIKTYADLTAALNGHVLASGELVALAHAPAAAPVSAGN
jgi:Raf kinase inhibitor-like YbhB/YbcL family protein